MRNDSEQTMADIKTRLRQVVAEHAGLGRSCDTLSDEDDLWEAGMNSLASVQLLLAVEETFQVEFPDEAVTRETFSHVYSIAEAVAALLASPQGHA
jgi:acyl carrier protein